ncbi:ABC transporter ATP-binding protein [Pseudomonas citronellolis]|uniref:ABC transporter ATP-binding protein n=1 Tax=Pseudomonas citronellolis TaxID=53408 RepID=UPI0023E378FA|nr:ABC transporter ATP-binding protein [Pseudomonas citronellolis]MDF3933603.1 ABC transporter ATP-binding protein [Pseudomonas citronellolis]
MNSDTVVRLEGISKRYLGGVVSVDNLDLEVRQGEFLCLLGPSGCGKTSTLRIIAGFEEPSAGRVYLDGRDVTDAPPYGRPVNTVFQDYALFPHLSVRDNVGFGLSVARVPAAEARKRIESTLELVGLAAKASSRVQALSGGQQQRVAMARALVCEPRVLLLDEPLSALDAHLRQQMQVELKKLQTRLGTTFIMVTHDQTEALAISDRIAVMRNGRLEQVASPAELYDAPASPFVAGFIGATNLLEGHVVSQHPGAVGVRIGSLEILASSTQPLPPGSPVTVSLRPEDMRLALPGDGQAKVRARIAQSIFHGRSLRLHLELPGIDDLTLDVPREAFDRLSAGDGASVELCIPPGSARAYASSPHPIA